MYFYFNTPLCVFARIPKIFKILTNKRKEKLTPKKETTLVLLLYNLEVIFCVVQVEVDPPKIETIVLFKLITIK